MCERSIGWSEQRTAACVHEEPAWQAEPLRAAGRIHFEPDPVVQHHNRPGFLSLLRRLYHWCFSAIETKARPGRRGRLASTAPRFRSGPPEARPRWE